ncbi:hypothetical protein [Desulfothermobacter acidiphilus]|uniref:hypothetical protein n=1 Tax=Desulfothermobacter acidiphilus TaxID=1938353 RepID=UPI003F8943A0
MLDFGFGDFFCAFRHVQDLLLGVFALLVLTGVLRVVLWAVFGAFVGEYFGSLAATVTSLGLAVVFAMGGGLEWLGSLVSGYLAGHTAWGQVQGVFGELQRQLDQLQGFLNLPF